MLWLHPLIELLAIVLGVFALVLGFQRFRALHLGRRAVFAWKRHVWVGVLALCGWLGGLIGGFIMSALYIPVGPFFSGTHTSVALVMAPLILFGLATGYILHTKKRKRTWLPLVHGLVNLVLVALALSQGVTGWVLVRHYLLS